MRKLQDDSEAAFLRRLATIPDGTWSEEGWMEVAMPGDRGLYSAKDLIAAVDHAEKAIAANSEVYPLHAALLADFNAVMVQQARSALDRTTAEHIATAIDSLA